MIDIKYDTVVGTVQQQTFYIKKKKNKYLWVVT